MLHFKLLSRLLALVFFVSFLQTHSFVSTAYATLLGSEDASEWYQTVTRQALNDFGVDSRKVGVKRMNGVGPFVAGEGLYSFSMFNIWYDEFLLEECSPEKRLFVVYHEAAHIALKHHRTQLLSSLLLLPLIKIVPYVKNMLVEANNAFTSYGATTLLSVAGLTGGYVMLTYLCRQQEKEADVAAAKLLLKMGKVDIVHKHVQELKQLIDAGLGDQKQTWHHTFFQQYEYMQNILTT